MKHIGIAIAALLSSVSSSATATRLMAVFNGYVASGVDAYGHFGAASANLAGKLVKTTYYIDDDAPGAINIHGQYSRTTHTSSSFDERYSGHILGRVSIGDAYFDVEGALQSGFYGEPSSRSAYAHSRLDGVDIQLGAGITNTFFRFNSGEYSTPGTYYAGQSQQSFFTYKPLTSDYGTALGLIFSSVTVSQGWDINPRQYVTPPTDYQLSQMSAAAYPTTVPPPVDRFETLKTVSGYDGFGATVYREDGQIVIAFRGTLLDDAKDSVANIAADHSFTAGKSSDILISNYQQATALLLEMQRSCPSCAINLTGHSLGGALAQILGDFTGLPATSFNAPGTGALLDNLRDLPQYSALKSTPFVNVGDNRNIRAYGDIVSQVGVPVGKQITINTANDAKADSIGGTVLNVLTLHSMNNVRSSLECIAVVSNCALNMSPGVSGPLINDAMKVLAGTAVSVADIRFTIQVLAGEYYALDPAGYTIYELLSSDGSSNLKTLILPAIDGVFQYKVNEFLNGEWGESVFIQDNTSFDFNTLSSGFRFQAIDSDGKTIELANSFAFLLSFSLDGTFDGVLSMSRPAAVPEPESWAMMLIGFGLVGYIGRSSKRRRTSKTI